MTKRTEGRTNKAGCRVVCTRLKIGSVILTSTHTRKHTQKRLHYSDHAELNESHKSKVNIRPFCRGQLFSSNFPCKADRTNIERSLRAFYPMEENKTFALGLGMVSSLFLTYFCRISLLDFCKKSQKLYDIVIKVKQNKIKQNKEKQGQVGQ